jgi:rRNA maturation endonuclease Nob1
VRSKKEPEPTPVAKPTAIPVKYVYVCDDCKERVDKEARVCPFCQARFTGGIRRNNERQRNERLTQTR